MKKRAKYYTDESCPHCDREVRIPARVKPLPVCPKCHKKLLPCSACSSEETDAGCNGCSSSGSNFKLHEGFKRKKTGFRLDTIIRIADKAYSESTDLPLEQNVLRAFKGLVDPGDILAGYVAMTLKRTYEPYSPKTDQLQRAVLAMEKARARLENVECALKERLRKEYKKEGK